MQWRSQTIIFFGGGGHISNAEGVSLFRENFPRENFEIWSPSMAISRVSGERFCIILKIIYCRKDLIFNDFSIMWILNLQWRHQGGGGKGGQMPPQIIFCPPILPPPLKKIY